MILILDDKKLLSTVIAGVAIYTAVVLKNGGEQLGLEKHFISNIFGKALFVAGWLLMGFSISGLPNLSIKSGLAYGGSLGVIASVFAMKSGIIPKEYAMALFVLSWLAVAISVGLGKENASKYLAAFAFASVMASMLFVLPVQRRLNIVDGPGMLLFGLTFLFLSLANSLDV